MTMDMALTVLLWFGMGLIAILPVSIIVFLIVSFIAAIKEGVFEVAAAAGAFLMGIGFLIVIVAMSF